jgi:hypothetical protein
MHLLREQSLSYSTSILYNSLRPLRLSSPSPSDTAKAARTPASSLGLSCHRSQITDFLALDGNRRSDGKALSSAWREEVNEGLLSRCKLPSGAIMLLRGEDQDNGMGRALPPLNSSYTCVRTLFRSLGSRAWPLPPHAPDPLGLTPAIIPSITSNRTSGLPYRPLFARRLPVRADEGRVCEGCCTELIPGIKSLLSDTLPR